MQWFNLLATRTRRLSLFQQNPLGGPKTRNVYLFPAMAMALALAWCVYASVVVTLLDSWLCLSFFSYIGWFQKIFLTRGIKAEYFFLPMTYVFFLDIVFSVLLIVFRYGFGVLFMDEARKWWVRGHPLSVLAKIAW